MTSASDSKVEATVLPALKSPVGTQDAARRSCEWCDVVEGKDKKKKKEKKERKTRKKNKENIKAKGKDKG